MQKYYGFWIQKSWKWTKLYLDPDIVEMVHILDPETTKILPFLDPEIMKMNQQVSGSINRRNGRQILYVQI